MTKDAFSKFVYDNVVAIVDKLDLTNSGKMLLEETIEFLLNESNKRFIASAWEYMNEKELEHFKDFSDQSYAIDPNAKNEDILLDFVLLYPHLVRSVSADLEFFWEEFVRKSTRK